MAAARGLLLCLPGAVGGGDGGDACDARHGAGRVFGGFQQSFGGLPVPIRDFQREADTAAVIRGEPSYGPGGDDIAPGSRVSYGGEGGANAQDQAVRQASIP